MGVDLRQVVAGILTITMFVMLGQMLHRDYFDSLQVIFFADTFYSYSFQLSSSGFCLILLLDAF